MRVLDVEPESGLTIRPRGYQPERASAPQRYVLEEAGGQLPSVIFERHRGHPQPDVVRQQFDDAVQVASLVRPGQPCHDLPFGRGVWRWGWLMGAAAGQVTSQGAARSFQGTLHRLLGRVKHFGHFAGAKVQHIAQDQHGALPRWK